MKSTPTAISHHSVSGCCANHDNTSFAAKEAASNASFRHTNTTEAMLHITGMRCGDCAEKVRTALTNIDGVIDAQVRFAESSAKVRYDYQQTDVAAICSVLDAAGYLAHSSGPESSSSAFTLPAGWLKHRPVKSVTLIIRDVADVPERAFTWIVKP
jgi:copper chaperone CopZ